MKIKVGFGYDVHRMVDGHPFVLGGVKIDYPKGAFGHSDADVLLHVICDALLGAANLRDIGFNFPDTDQKYKGINSKILLKECYRLVKEKGYHLSNIDCTICLQQPKVNPFIPQMKEGIAELLEVDVDDISIKATTSEKLGFVGREEGISAYCTCLIQSV
jgi:2-C-methyl-D-erythritol 2,4-cyclodiphosphate synthase